MAGRIIHQDDPAHLEFLSTVTGVVPSGDPSKRFTAFQRRFSTDMCAAFRPTLPFGSNWASVWSARNLSLADFFPVIAWHVLDWVGWAAFCWNGRGWSNLHTENARLKYSLAEIGFLLVVRTVKTLLLALDFFFPKYTTAFEERLKSERNNTY